jgi:two-component system, NtrC family, response regulator HydG
MTQSIDEKFGDLPTTKLSTAPASSRGHFALTVVEGVDRGQRLELDGLRPGRLLIGQSPACELKLTDPTVSRRHAAVEQIDDRLLLVDLSSSNGTWIDRLAIREAFLAGGERVRLGETVLEVHRLDGGYAPPPAATSFGGVVGASEPMRRLYPLCERLAQSAVPLVIEGETGTGKEVLAEALHERGPRAPGPFVVFDCSSVAPNLLEAALFGHERGAFTGAVSARPGVFEEAHQGTLLIDEIGDLDINLQAKLLRAIQSSEVRRIGGAKWLKVDVRVIAATRRDLDREVQAGRFRDDLFFRIAVARIELPPLRSRPGDMPRLAQHFWTQLGGLGAVPAALLQRYADYSWPGNVRELSNVVARQLALGDLAPAGASGISGPSVEASPPAGDAVERVLELDLPLPVARQKLVEEFERRYVERVLRLHNGHVAKAAAASGVARRYFQLLKARQGK